MKTIIASMLLLLLLSLSQTTSAHFLWMSLDEAGRTVSLELADSPGKDIAPILFQLKDRFKTHGLGPLSDTADHQRLTAPVNSKDKAVGAEAEYGVFQNWLVHWSAKAAMNATQAQTAIGLAAEILLKKEGRS